MVRFGITFGYLLCPVIRRSAEDAILGVLPRFWACFSTVRVDRFSDWPALFV